MNIGQSKFTELESLSPLTQVHALSHLVWPGTHLAFRKNWVSTTKRYPKELPVPKIISVRAKSISVESALRKNSDETDIYLQVLRTKENDLEKSAYVQEIQIRSHGQNATIALAKARKFQELAKSIKKDGVRKPILLANVEQFDLPYQMFRFDGHHRAICALSLGLEKIPAFIFELTD
ncbi:ParB N-terminal domain-containing protein [Duganella sp. CY15W]|uniref:ParB/RepB/Spo0J family partition protein n=1 Tax=Duganella sp. CY15W TaxID=2692172 RepID=UPI00136F0A74|nr:ParB/RepB/Spo0J family partition protein [Duganella sp. CY15W]MYM31658.1 ParB N-terminal domain-containing protein [Duganella sp. CY15W]